MSNQITKHRKSIFREELDQDTETPSGLFPSEQVEEFTELTGVASTTSTHAPESASNDDGGTGGMEPERQQTQQGQDVQEESRADPTLTPSTPPRRWYSRLGRVRRPRIKTVSSAPPPSMSTITRLSSIALLIAVLLPGFSYYRGREEAAPNVAEAGVTYTTAAEAAPVLESRAAESSPTDVCKRWAHQSELNLSGKTNEVRKGN
jgi:hypothetical protein